MLANPKGNKLTVVDCVEYPSRAEAARQLGVSRKTVENWVKNGKPTAEESHRNRSESHKGYVWTDEAKKKLSETNKRNAHAATPIEINGVRYESIAFAAAALNVKRDVVGRMLKSGKATKLQKA